MAGTTKGQVLVDVFRGRGIEVTGVEDLMTSAHKSDDENRAILLAWSDLRDMLDCPRPVRRTVDSNVARPVPVGPRPVGPRPGRPVPVVPKKP